MKFKFGQKIIDLLRGKKQDYEMDVPAEKSHYGNRHIYMGTDGDKIIINELLKDKPSLICRYGSVELSAVNYFLHNTKNIINFPESIKTLMSNNAGFFPANDYMLSQFSSELIDVTKNIDVIGVWFNPGEEEVLEKYAKNAKLVHLSNIDPTFKTNSWSNCLKGKKVLVIHPFEETIISQYQKRNLLFENQNTLPEFELITLKPVQSIADSKKDLAYENWFEALEYTKSKIKEIDFDIALIAAGAYGIFLADFCKQLGKKAVHTGGCLQLLFGIKGKRWMDENSHISKLINENWIFPDINDRPKGYEKVENGTYW